VVNFLVAALTVFVILSSTVTIMILTHPEMTGEHQARLRGILEEHDIGVSYFVISIAVSAVLMTLLIVSGVGYLMQKKILGRILGSSFAVLSLARNVVEIVTLPEDGGGGVDPLRILVMTYALLTLVLLNTTFRRDFVN